MTRLAGIAWFLLGCWIAAGVWRIGSQPMVQLVTPKETVIQKQVFTGLAPVGKMEVPK